MIIMPNIGKKQYMKRQDRVCAELHFNICKEIGVNLENEQWYKHVTKLVATDHGGQDTILQNQQAQTDGTIPINKPGIIISDNEGTCMLIDVAIPGERNVIKKGDERILKYKDLTIETRACRT
jgi:hypothetical protein